MEKDSIYKRYALGTEPEGQLEECSYWFVFYNDKVLINTHNNRGMIPFVHSLEELNISPVRMQYMGVFQEHSCYVAETETIEELPSGMCFYEVRALYPIVDLDVFLLAGKGLQIINWDKTHQFCGRCGSKTNTMSKEMAKICPNCGMINYTRISPAVIVGIFKEDKILLAHSSVFKGKMYSILAGYVEAGETLEDGVKREVMEEVGIAVKNIKYFGSQAWPFSSSMMIGFTADYESGEICVDDDEITDAGWFDVNSLPELPSEYSIAREIINEYIKANTLAI